MTLAALVSGNVAEIQRMFECLISFMTCGTLPGVLVAQSDRMLEHAVRRNKSLASEALIYRRMADAAFIADRLTFAAEVLSVMTSKAPLGIEMTDIVDMR